MNNKSHTQKAHVFLVNNCYSHPHDDIFIPQSHTEQFTIVTNMLLFDSMRIFTDDDENNLYFLKMMKREKSYLEKLRYCKIMCKIEKVFLNLLTIISS